MPYRATHDRIRFLLNRIRERLWVKPLAICLLSIGAAFAAKLMDATGWSDVVPDVSSESIQTLLEVMAASMLVIATFAVASMVSAYASASSTATPRSFTLVVADDVSQNALSTFIGAFIFSIVGLTAVENGYYGATGRFTVFVLMILVFAIVVFTFVRWVDRIARLGRMGTTIARIEQAAHAALLRRREQPALRGLPAGPPPHSGTAIYSDKVGYVQQIDMDALQQCAEAADATVTVAALPGTFAAPGRPLAHVEGGVGDAGLDAGKLRDAFLIGSQRVFDDDPRFGLVVLSEISGRALSPAVNDPGTAIGIVGTLVRLFVQWHEAPGPDADEAVCRRVRVPLLAVDDMFDDAFTATARDGAGSIEVVVRLLKGLESLAVAGNTQMREAALRHARDALARAELELTLPADRERARASARFASRGGGKEQAAGSAAGRDA